MSQGSQVANVDLVSALSGLMHNIFVGDVVPNVQATSPTSQLFQDAKPGEYRLEGSALVGAADLTYSGGAMATAGDLPDHQSIDAVQWQATPVRRYRRIAMDNHAVRRATGAGAFGDLSERIFNQLWDSWSRMEIRHAFGDSNGYIGKCSSRTDADTVVIKDLYGHAGTNPGIHLEAGMIIGWQDASSTYANGGAGVIASITYGTNTVTVNITSSATWEPSAQIAAGDPICFATTTSISTDYFDTEYTLAPHGLCGIVDPDHNFTTVLNVAESGNPRWNTYRQASATFDHLEVTEFLQKLAQKSTSPVNTQSHVLIAQPAMVAELGRTLEGFQQQQNLGRTFEGGYQSVRIKGFDFVEDGYSLHDVLFAVCVEDLFRVNLGGDAHMWGEDGSQFSRLADYDGVEAFAVDYMQTFSPRRNRHGCLTGVALSSGLNAYDFDPSPNNV